MSFFMIPLIGVVVIIYNVLIFMFPDAAPAGDALIASSEPAILGKSLFTMTMVSGAPFSITIGMLLVSVGVMFLYIELMTSVKASSAAIVNHALSVAVLVGCVIELLTVPGCATAVFLYITLLQLLDVVAGFTVSIVSARRDLGIESFQ